MSIAPMARYVVARLRDQQRYDEIDALVAQMRQDVARTRDILD